MSEYKSGRIGSKQSQALTRDRQDINYFNFMDKYVTDNNQEGGGQR